MSSLDVDLDLLSIISDNWQYTTEIEKTQSVLYFLDELTKPTCDIFDKDASFVEWITSHFYIPETVFSLGDSELKGPLWLSQYQIDALNEATSKDKDGKYNYSLIVWSDIKKSIKSTIAAAVALRMAFLQDWASIKVIANKKEQAQSRSYYYLTRALKLNPETNRMLQDGDISISRYTVKFNFNNSSIQALPLNPEGEAGGNDDLIIWTEAWAARSKAAITMNTEMVIPPNKFGKGFKWLESYAGYTGEAPILEPLYENNVQEEYLISDEYPFYKNDRTFVLWNQVPRLPWQTPEYYKQQTTELIEEEFNRVHRNQWVSSQNIFVDAFMVDDLLEKLPPLNPKELMFLAVDASETGDCFAVVGVTKHPKNPKRLAARIAKIWTPKKKQPLQYEHPNPKINAKLPDGFITALCKKYNVRVIGYDPYQLHKMATDHNLQRKSAYWEKINQGAPRLIADGALRQAIYDGSIAIDENLTDLIEHLKNANAKLNENKIRLVKRSNKLKIDAAVALSMAQYIAKKYGQ